MKAILNSLTKNRRELRRINEQTRAPIQVCALSICANSVSGEKGFGIGLIL